jgi:hypothetical protein
MNTFAWSPIWLGKNLQVFGYVKILLLLAYPKMILTHRST